MAVPSISAKTNRVLQVILLSFVVIVFRIWHLGVIQREEKLQEAQKPQQRTLLVRANRGTICDRFHIPLAVNRICYNAAIYYSQIAQIPVTGWKFDSEGNRVRSYPRKEYIRELSALLSQTLDLEKETVEDWIHSKAALFPHVPYIIKASLSEEEHYRLKMLEGDWLGIHAEIAAERYYPLGKCACNVIGTMGAIDQKQYNEIAEELWTLKQAIETGHQGAESPLPCGYHSLDEVLQRYHELKEKAYTFSDLVGKTGVESRFEEELRGYFGKKTFEVDQKGRALRELPGGKAAIPGREVVLSISAELQQYAEWLLAQDERVRDGRSIGIDPVDKKRKIQKQPWIKGGAIVALDPHTGEVLALASHPRFDPNDFIPSAEKNKKQQKQRQIGRWLENETLIASIWDGKETLIRERSKGPSFTEESLLLSWETFLDWILPTESPLKTFFSRHDSVLSAVQIQEDFEDLLYFSKVQEPHFLMDALFPPDSAEQRSASRLQILEILRASPDSAAPWKRLEMSLSPIASNKEKLFAIDLCRTAVYSPAFSDLLIAEVGSMKLSAYRSLNQAFQRIEAKVKKQFEETFHREEFSQWREAHQKEFLAEKRKEEKERKTFARPYLDYLEQKEKELFSAYWKEKRLPILLHEIGEQNEETTLRDFCKNIGDPLGAEFLHTLRSFSELDRPLLFPLPSLRKKDQTEKDLAASFYPTGGFGFSRSYAFQSGSPQGSLFKLVTGFEALRQGVAQSLSLIDELVTNPQHVAYSLNGVPYPRYYKGGRLPRSHTPQIGKVDFLGALEQSSNSYFAILAGDYFANPEDLSEAAIQFGYGKKTGIELPGEYRGGVPTDLKRNRTGLYSTAIGQHTLLNTPLQSALMLSAIANGGSLLKPKIVKEITGSSPQMGPLDAFAASSYFAKDELDALGIHFPLFTAIQPRSSIPSASVEPTEVKHSIPLSPSIRSQLLEGMDRAVWGQKGSARPSAIKQLLADPLLMQGYLSLKHQMIGKTSTAEISLLPSKVPSSCPQLYKNIWFGAISFSDIPSKTRWEDPELVVVVFLRFGDGGKEAAPLASQMIRKWREIKKKYENSERRC